MSEHDSVDVTGLGAVSPLGRSVPTFWRTLLGGDLAWTRCTEAQALTGAVFVGAIEEDLRATYRRINRHARTINRTFALLLEAAAEAVHDAHLDDITVPAERMAVVLAVGALDSYTDLEEVLSETRDDAQRPIDALRTSLDPLRRLKHLPNIGASLVSIEHQAGGPAMTLAGGHASGLMAILEGHALIVEGAADVVICGGADSRLQSRPLAQFGAVTCLSRATERSAACLPFHASSTGTVASEGAAIVILERRSSAKRRGVGGYAEIVGGCATGSTCEGSLADALAGAVNLNATRSIGAILTHGEGTHALDQLEAKVSPVVFPSHRRPQLTSIKGHLGHTMSAAGAFNMVAGCLAIRHGSVPAMPKGVRPVADLPFVIGWTRPLAFPTVIACAVDPHGGVSSVLLRNRSL